MGDEQQVYQKVRPKGGFKVHIKPKGKWAALCGYAPSAPKTFLMKDRSGWVLTNGQHLGARECEKCHKRVPDGAVYTRDR